ncbi:hypothetical protein PG996_002925 [Apiospora saccharicola]|uniref:Uncharacterized protein n=1 Tax=Apiospora saccharicola TaxID=335842 RepID=A0ABR1WKT7_9PEZI
MSYYNPYYTPNPYFAPISYYHPNLSAHPSGSIIQGQPAINVSVLLILPVPATMTNQLSFQPQHVPGFSSSATSNTHANSRRSHHAAMVNPRQPSATSTTAVKSEISMTSVKEETITPTRSSRKRSSSHVDHRPSKARKIKQEHEVVYISSDSEPEPDAGAPQPSITALQLSPKPMSLPGAQGSGQSSPYTDEEVFSHALLLEDCLLLSSLDLDTHTSNDVVVRRHSFNSRIQTAVVELRKARIEEWRAVRELTKSNPNGQCMHNRRVAASQQLIESARIRLDSMIPRRVNGMIQDGRQPGLHGDDLNRLRQHFSRVGQLRTSRPSITGPNSHSAGILGLESVGHFPVPIATTPGVILPHALFPHGHHPLAEAWKFNPSSRNLLPIESGRVRIILCMAPLPVSPAATQSEHSSSMFGGFLSTVGRWLQGSVGHNSRVIDTSRRVEEVEEVEEEN